MTRIFVREICVIRVGGLLNRRLTLMRRMTRIFVREICAIGVGGLLTAD
jgi:hypothetical protein